MVVVVVVEEGNEEKEEENEEEEETKEVIGLLDVMTGKDLIVKGTVGV